MTAVQLVYPKGKYKAVTFSYDDGGQADERLVALFNRYQLKATFHLCSSWLSQPGYCASDAVLTQYAGHEVACHSVTHPTMTRLSSEGMVAELTHNRKHLECIMKRPVKGFAYPNGAYHQQLSSLLPHLGIDYARVATASGHFNLPKNWYEWQPTAHHNDDLFKKCEQFVTLNKSQYLYVFHIWGHSYEFDRDQTWDDFERCCERLSKDQNSWFVTCGELYDYVQRFNGLKFSVDCNTVYNPYAESVWLKRGSHIVEAKGGLITHLSI